VKLAARVAPDEEEGGEGKGRGGGGRWGVLLVHVGAT
jgi:hypothetical protein